MESHISLTSDRRIEVQFWLLKTKIETLSKEGKSCRIPTDSSTKNTQQEEGLPYIKGGLLKVLLEFSLDQYSGI